MQGHKVHLIGIGGIGLSALAQLLQKQGYEVSGCDRSASPVTDLLKNLGIEVHIGNDPAHIDSAEEAIYSDAIYPDHPERMRAQERNIPQRSYFEALGEMTKEYHCIAVAGAHGKTTTTAMLVDILEEAGLDPTAVVGSLRAKTRNNFRSGKGRYFIVEADEYRRHFLNFTPQILVITNIDADHLDYYKDLADIQQTFRELAQKVPPEGYVICNSHDASVAPVIDGLSNHIVDYKKYIDPSLPLKVLPLHQANAAAALAVAEVLGIEQKIARQALSNFTGTWRRFEYVGVTGSGAVVYDDYGHHPTEISATLQSVREKFPGKRVLLAFHPHLYSRTKALMDGFAEALSKADEVVLAPIFAAREEPDPTVSSEILAERIRVKGTPARALSSFEEIEQYLEGASNPSDLILTMGAGDIYKVAEALVKNK